MAYLGSKISLKDITPHLNVDVLLARDFDEEQWNKESKQWNAKDLYYRVVIQNYRFVLEFRVQKGKELFITNNLQDAIDHYNDDED